MNKKKKTEKDLLEKIKELEKRPKDNVTISDCYIKTDIIYDAHVLNTIHLIAAGLNHNALALKNLSKTLSSERIEVTAIKIGAEEE